MRFIKSNEGSERNTHLLPVLINPWLNLLVWLAPRPLHLDLFTKKGSHMKTITGQSVIREYKQNWHLLRRGQLQGLQGLGDNSILTSCRDHKLAWKSQRCDGVLINESRKTPCKHIHTKYKL